MRLDTRLCAFLGGALTALVLAVLPASEPTPPRATTPAEPAALVAPQEMPKPGPEHAWLAERAGKWKVAMRMSMPDGTWMKSTGTETCEMICGGFWQSAVQKGTFMGMDFEGRMLLGYDQNKQRFVGTWIDSFGSWPVHMEGDLYQEGKLLVMHCSMLDPQKGKSLQVRMETHLHDADSATFRMYMPGPEGKTDHLHMEQKYTRIK